MKLRNYQQSAVDAVIECWKTCRSCVVILPTGCGKTVVFGEVIRRRLAGKRSMILAHRGELIHQAADKVGRICDTAPLIEMGEYNVDGLFGETAKVIVSTVQTQNTGRMYKFDPADFDTLVIDEAHHATSKSYRQCVEHYFENPDCRLLGVTATPDRADETALGLVFEKVAYEYSVTEAIHDGWLVPVKQKLVKVGSLDFSGISTTAGDFNQKELGDLLEEERNLHAVAAPTVEICGSRRAIVFAATVRQAERLCEILNRLRPDSAEWLCGKTPKDRREAILKGFGAGKTQYVVNVGVLTEGFDDAGVEVVVMARPTKSRALYAQMAGRATRPAAEIAAKLGENDRESRVKFIAASSKPCCLIVDFVGNSGRHKLVSSADILGGKDRDPDEEEARRRAKKRCEESKDGLDVAEELEKAREDIAREREEAAARKLAEEKDRKFIIATAKYTTFSVDPFDVLDIMPVDRQAPNPFLRKRLSYKQRAIIRDKLHINPDSVTNAEGQILISELFRRINAHMPTVDQLYCLRKHGIPVIMSFEEAHETITRLKEKRS